VNWRQAIVAVVLAILKWIAGKFTPRSQDGQGPGEREDRLKDKIRKDGWYR
jgi:hypothetical protein